MLFQHGVYANEEMKQNKKEEKNQKRKKQ